MQVIEPQSIVSPGDVFPREESSKEAGYIIAQIENENGVAAGPPVHLPENMDSKILATLLRQLLIVKKDNFSLSEEEEPLIDGASFSFFLNEEEIINSVGDVVKKQSLSREQTLTIIYRPQALFRVRAVTRCSGSLPGHTEAVLAVAFSPCGRFLASASGDTTVRLWDLTTDTPLPPANTSPSAPRHRNWVLYLAWSPCGSYLVSGGMDNDLYVWSTGGQVVRGSLTLVAGPLKGHSKWITFISFEPFHRNPVGNRFASSSKDGTVRIWDIIRKRTLFTLGQHTMSVTCVRWGGSGLIYSASQDRSIKVWRAEDGVLCRNLTGHAHWINHLAISTEYAIRTGPFDHHGKREDSIESATECALKRYNLALCGSSERLVSGSDDFTMYLWNPCEDKKPILRMTGHQQLINHVSFSPDGSWLASASFDKSIRLWNGRTGVFVCTLRGHVGSVYGISWSGDSRMLVSASKDSTLKVWDLRTRKLKVDLPGHADEVYAVDWSPVGDRVASGGKDKVLKIWRT